MLSSKTIAPASSTITRESVTCSAPRSFFRSARPVGRATGRSSGRPPKPQSGGATRRWRENGRSPFQPRSPPTRAKRSPSSTAAGSRRYSIPIDVSLHAPSRKGDRRNFHAHLLGSTRSLGRDGFGAKTRQLDDGRGYGEVVRCREEWARICNRELVKIGAPLVSAKSLAAQREDALAEAEHFEKAAARLESWRHHDIQNVRSAADRARKEAEALDREPTIHVGPAGTEMNRSGRHSNRAAENEAILIRNETRRRARSLRPVQAAPQAVAPAAPVRPAARPATPALSVVAKAAAPAKPVPQATPAKPTAPVPAAPLRPASTPAVPPAAPAPAPSRPAAEAERRLKEAAHAAAEHQRQAAEAQRSRQEAVQAEAERQRQAAAHAPAPAPARPKKPADPQRELEKALIAALEGQTPQMQGICAYAFRRQREIPTNRGMIKDYAAKHAPSYLVKLLEVTWEKASKALLEVMERYWRERNQRLAARTEKPTPGRGIGD